MTENPDHPISPAVADQNNVGPEPHGTAKPQEEELRVEGEEGVTLAATKTVFERRVGIVKDIVQTFGIIAAGIFAVVKFGIIDEPTLEKQLRVSGSLNWLQRPDFCIGYVEIEVTNMSKSRIDVGKIDGASWLIDEPVKPPDHITHFDIRNTIAHKDPSDPFSYINGPLVHLYLPGQSSHHTFEWLVPRKRNYSALLIVERG